MIDFASFIREGIESHERQESDRLEIQAVFIELNDQIAAITGGRANLGSVRKRTSTALEALSEGPSYVAIVISSSNKDFEPLEIARWRQSDEGYPATLKFSDQAYECFDREAVENALAELMKLPTTGRAIALASQA